MDENKNLDKNNKENEIDNLDEDILPLDIQNAIKDLPPKERKEISKFLSISMMSGGMQVSSMKHNPIIEKMNTEHIHKVLDYSNESDKREFWAFVYSKLSILIFTIIGIGVFTFITLFFGKTNPTLYQDILGIVLPFLIGIAGGFGLGKSSNKSKE